MFIRFRKSRIAGIISKCAYCIFMTGTILYFINKIDDVFSRQMWKCCWGARQWNAIFKPSKSPALIFVLKIMNYIYHTIWGKWLVSVWTCFAILDEIGLFYGDIHEYLPDLISIWHFGVRKYGPDSPSVFYRLWKHTHKDETTSKTISLINPLIITQKVNAKL